MSLIFPYTSQPTSTPIWSLSGRQVRPRPVIFVAVIGPAGVAVEKGLLDSGADDTVFSEQVANDIGLDLSQAPTRTAAGVGSTAVAIVKYAEVILRISDGHENREWTARVGFTSSPLHRPLLGFAGFLQFFTATFRGDREQIELAVNSSYQGK
jgi:predicted aspartyl protease